MTNNVQLKNVRYMHQYIADWLIANPDRHQYELAEELGITEPWLSVIVNSDSFKEYYTLRRERVHEKVGDEVAARVNKVANLTLEVLEERIERERNTVGIGVVRDVAAMSLRALGFGQPQPVPPGRSQTNIFFGSVDRDSLAAAREKIRRQQVLNETEGEKDGEKLLDGTGCYKELPAAS